MMRVCRKVSILYYNPKRIPHTAHGINGWVVGIRNDERELRTCVPALRCPLRVSVVKIDRHRIVWRSIGITEGKEQDSPRSGGLSTSVVKELT